ncbi:uncharacterized protein LOC124284763 [Haliotis rubra]|uniref:uncharacterized protein LOC124284763 n=1 Tax=Haliotis rubra TaxID=36100 RepID=UPI001EE5C5FC|nr:uncharacterized protein LOC124284763 [Haliotis rubra]
MRKTKALLSRKIGPAFRLLRYKMVDSADKMKIKQEVQDVHDNMANAETQTRDGTSHDSLSNDATRDRSTVNKTDRGTDSSHLHDRQEQVTDKHSSRQSFTVSGTNQIMLNSQQSVVMRNGFTQEKNISASETDHTRIPQNSIIMADREIAIKLERSDNEVESESIKVEQSQYHETGGMNSGDVFMRSDSSFPSEVTIKEEDDLQQVTTNQGENANKTLNTGFINKRTRGLGK